MRKPSSSELAMVVSAGLGLITGAGVTAGVYEANSPYGPPNNCDPALTADDYSRALHSGAKFEANVLEPRDKPGLDYVVNIYEPKRRIYYPLVVCKHGITSYIGRDHGKLVTIPASNAWITELYGNGGGQTHSAYDETKVGSIVQRVLKTEPVDLPLNVNPHPLGFEQVSGKHYDYGQLDIEPPSS